MNARRALIVDDDRFFRTVLDRVLSQAGFETAQTENGNQALEVIGGFAPELLVLDIWMPGDYDGVEVCRRVRADRRYAQLIIVMMSASDKRKETDRCIEAGANMFLPKPFTPKHFLQQVKLIYRERGGSL